MATNSTSHIYTGPWVNWDHGLVRGSTITLNSRDGGLLTSFLGVFVTVVGGQLWKIVSFTLHQLRSSRGPQDGLHHQHQNILRNTTSPGGAAWQFLQLTFYWWNRAKRPVLRSFPWAILGLAYLAVFGVAGVFSSEVTKAAGDDRLIRSNNCGYWRLDGSGSLQAQNAFNAKTLNDTIEASNYARSCYGGSHDPLQCSTFVNSEIKWTSDQNATCPFENGTTCVWSDTAAYKMETQEIDSHVDLGINAPIHHRVKYKKVTTCAPIHTKGFVDIVNGTDGVEGVTGDTIFHYLYGPVVDSTSGNDITNYTVSYNTHSYIDQIGYGVDTYTAFVQSDNAWNPIPALNRTDADVSIVGIAPNSIRFDTVADDPIFSAHTLGGSYLDGKGQNVSWYVSDYWVSFLACAEQHQICNPNTGACTDPQSSSTLLAATSSLNLNLVQQGAMQRIMSIAQFTNIYQSISGRGGSALRAQETVLNLDQASLPANQWQIEVGNWFSTGLARLQKGILEYAQGSQNVLPGTYIWKPTDIVSKAMCYSQKVQTTSGTISFSVLGLAIILAIGGTIILISLILDSVVGFCQRKFGKGEYARLNWILDDKFQLQRMVFEEVGMGTWDLQGTIPVTAKGEKFGGWEGVDMEHPTLSGNRAAKTERWSDSAPEGEGLMQPAYNKTTGVNAYEV